MNKLIISLLFLLTILSTAYAIETIISHEEIRFDLLRTDPSPLEPGKTFDIWFDVTNVETYTINNLKISEVSVFPFSIKGINQSSIIINEIKPGEKKSIKFTVEINKNINEGIYQLPLQYYSNRLDAIVSKTFDLSIKTTKSIVTTTDVKITPEKVNPGSTFEIEIGIINSVNYDITDLTADLGLGSTPFTAIGGSSEKKIRQLAPNANAVLKYTLISDPNTELKSYKLPLIITYHDRLGSEFIRNTTIGITVYAKPEYNLDLEGTEVFTKGQTGEITLSFANKGNSEIKFLNIELLKSNDYDIISNPRVYIGNLKSDDFETATYKIHAKTPKPVKLNLKVGYKDSYNNDFLDDAYVDLPLYSKWESQNLGLLKRDYTWLYSIISIAFLIIAYKFYKVWKFERDIERSIIILFKNTIKWLRIKLKM